MSELLIPPGLILVLGALLVPFLKGTVRQVYLLALPLFTLYVVWTLPEGSHMQIDFVGLTLEPLKVDKLSRIFGIIFALMAFGGMLFGLLQRKTQELSASFLYAGSALGVVFAGDLLTVFVFWETMAVASAIIIFSGGFKTSFGAAMRYLMVHFLGGVLLMAGIAAHFGTTGSIAFEVIGPPETLAAWLILAGFLINAGAPPFGVWVGDAYPEASYTGTVVLSAFTTKTAVFVLLSAFPGTELLIYFGLFMVMYGIVMALLENDMRRILCYSIVNQVGFMVTGVGIGTEMAMNGVAAHAFAHIIYKALLLMSAGAVLYQTGRRKCSDLGGLFRTMPVTTICGTIGAFAISSFPFTSGFVSKSMINDAAGYEHMGFVWFCLTAASAGVFLHAGIKFPWFVFFQKDSGLRPKDPPMNMQAAMVLFSALCIGIGCFPDPFYALLPYEVKYHPYSAYHVVNMLQLLMFSGLSFFLLLPLMKRTLTITLDFDWLYRRAGQTIALRSMDVWDGLDRTATGIGRGLGGAVYRAIHGLTGESAPLGGTARTGGTIYLITIGLGGALLLTYVVASSELHAVSERPVPEACRTMPSPQGLSKAKDRAAVYLVQGRCAFDAGRIHVAIAGYDLAVRERPDWYRVYELRAEAHDAIGETVRAEADRAKAADLKANPPAEPAEDKYGDDKHGGGH